MCDRIARTPESGVALGLQAPSQRTALRELTDSRARLFGAADRERRKLERDLHEGAQQRLMGIQIKLRLAQQRLGDEALEGIADDTAQLVEELRSLAHALYPQALRDFGLADALRAYAMTAARIPVEIDDEGIGRCAGTVEAAIYFCAIEAVNGATERAAITLGRDRTRVRFAIAGDGVENADGNGMRDRIGAVGGELEVISASGRPTIVRGTVPVGEDAP
jgi:signal transduction histidine kinase